MQRGVSVGGYALIQGRASDSGAIWAKPKTAIIGEARVQKETGMMLPKLNLLVIEDNQYDAEIVGDCLTQMDGTNCNLLFSESISDSRQHFGAQNPE